MFLLDLINVTTMITPNERWKFNRLWSLMKNTGKLSLYNNQFDNLGDLFDKNFPRKKHHLFKIWWEFVKLDSWRGHKISLEKEKEKR